MVRHVDHLLLKRVPVCVLGSNRVKIHLEFIGVATECERGALVLVDKIWNPLGSGAGVSYCTGWKPVDLFGVHRAWYQCAF